MRVRLSKEFHSFPPAEVVMQLSVSLTALLSLAFLGGCATGPTVPPDAVARADVTSSLPPPGVPARSAAASGEDVLVLDAGDRTDRPVPSRIAAVPGTVMIESAEDRDENRRRQLALHQMVTKRDRIVGDVVEGR